MGDSSIHPQPELFTYLLMLVLVWRAVLGALRTLAQESCFRWGEFHKTLRLSRALRWLSVGGGYRWEAQRLTVLAHEALGNTAEAVRRARILLASRREAGDWRIANTVVNTFINAGLYQEALAVEHSWGSAGERPQDGARLLEWCLVQLNLVEAV
ncbi:hypothetical protein [Archangium sp.]|uniref:hypothetical protein n=1 Tax=Archangium sp. TaxID=1872627 RepID=UPI00389A282D